MDIPAEVRAIEARLAADRRSVRWFCQSVGINTSTWQRWKSGSNGPTLRVWSAVQKAAAKLPSAEAA